MATTILRLNYPPSLIRQPIINQLIRAFNITVNILQAKIGLEDGWLEVHMTGDQAEVERAIAWLTAQGLKVDVLE